MLVATFLSAVVFSLTVQSKPCGKVIIDNDWYSPESWNTALTLLGANCTVLGITSSIGNVYVPTGTAHALRFLEVAQINYTDVYNGAWEPLINTYARAQSWQAVQGQLAYSGIFQAPESTSGTSSDAQYQPDPLAIGNITEGLPTTSANNMSAVEFLIQSARKYPGEISILAAGAMSTVALAVKQDPYFAGNIASVVIQGGYVDGNLNQTNPTPPGNEFSNDDIFFDLNFWTDPEAAKIVLNANFRETILAGSCSLPHLVTQDLLDNVTSVSTPITDFFQQYWTDVGVPLWDPIAAGVLAYPELVIQSRRVYATVDTAYASPFYGRTLISINPYQPADARNITFVDIFDYDSFVPLFVDSMQGDYSQPR